ncbi:TIR domain-containing protein [Pseudoalteromonas sp. MMG012]|uniref:TIR domain-containing protein n=1 Tax=Pseudoalteromonas sp. MMG012 TaxID=2822686 RepID=UPI001B39E667|nr:TIR domain-containing protein [Pseudoalteromonas sp. MMG012]MBQ4851406.1 TIR domain-containing protein [Pseudoalteromonas sp. MMG012]
MAKTYSIFISHSWQNSDALTRLHNLLKERGYFNVEFEEVSKDEPINSSNADYIKRRLREKIDNSDIVLGLAGMYASHSDWMEWELDKALDLKVPIVGVIPRGQERISTTVSSRSITDVGWNTESIVAAIRDYSK